MSWISNINPMTWLDGIIVQKVIGKFVKHATGALIGLLTGPWFAAKVAPILNQLGVTIDWNSFSAGAQVLLIGLFGALWNWAQHRFFSKA